MIKKKKAMELNRKMTTLYKLTDAQGCTRNGTQWGAGVKNKATGYEGKGLCSDAYIHAYEHPLLALFVAPIHVIWPGIRLWKAEGEVAIRDGQMKCGCRELTTVCELQLIPISVEQRVRFAIGCAWPSAATPWREWALQWLQGRDRSEAGADSAMRWAGSSRARTAASAAAWAARSETGPVYVGATDRAAEGAAWAADRVVGVDLRVCADWAWKQRPITELHEHAPWLRGPGSINYQG